MKKRKKSVSIVCAGIMLLLMGCDGHPQQQVKEEMTRYFSLKEYMTGELKALRRSPDDSFQKIVTLNGKMDTVLFKDTGLLKIYFQPFIASDIDKPALKGTYKIDNTTDETTGDMTVLYTSTGKNTQPYQVQLQLDSRHNIKTLNITSYSHNLLYDLHKNLFYEPGRMIQITTDEKLILMPEKKLNVKILFGAPALSK